MERPERIAERAIASGNLRRAARAFDLAFALAPHDAGLARDRAFVLQSQAIEEKGIRWRYIPGGTFLMGSESGDSDERPVHPATTGEYWIAETPITWAAFCDLMGFSPAPDGMPAEARMTGNEPFQRRQVNKIRLQYCETGTTRAVDWHAHAAGHTGAASQAEALFGRPPREDPNRPMEYARKPMVAASYVDALQLSSRMSSPEIVYRLPTEAEWEKAARGGLVGCRWSWGDAPPDPSRCDFGHFGLFVVNDPLRYPANGYGLHGMCGGVWEWTSDVYDALGYLRPPGESISLAPEKPHGALRGGSWADCAEACTVTFRMSWPRAADWHGASPVIGFRMCRVETRATA